MKTIVLQSGAFTDKGNFTGYNAAGIRFHVPAKTIAAIGITPESVKTTPIAFPLYAIVVEREFNVLDESGEPTDKTFKREQAGSVFATKDALIEAYNADKVVGLEAAASLAKTAVASGLTEAQLAALLVEA